MPTIKVTTNPDNIELIKCWRQLEILEETPTEITVKGYERLIELVRLELWHREKRDPAMNYKVEEVNY